MPYELLRVQNGLKTIVQLNFTKVFTSIGLRALTDSMKMGAKNYSKISIVRSFSKNTCSFNAKSPFVVLGIETSCDDTGVSVVRSDGIILSSIVISQVGFPYQIIFHYLFLAESS